MHFNILILTLIFSFVFNTNSSANKGKLLKKKTIEITTQELLKVKASGADVFVSSWDSSKAEVKIFGKEKDANKFKFAIKKTDKAIFVLIKKGKKYRGLLDFFHFSIYNLKIKIKLPQKFKINILTSGGDIKIKNILGRATLLTSGGDVTCKKSSGQLEIKTSGGDIHVSGHTGNIEAKTSGGDIFANNSNGDVSLKTSGGDIKIIANNCKINASTSGGDIICYLKGSSFPVNLITSGGDISIKLSRQFKTSLKLKTTGGEISVKLPATELIEKTASLFKAKINGGGEQIEAETTGGDILVKTFSN